MTVAIYGLSYDGARVVMDVPYSRDCVRFAYRKSEDYSRWGSEAEELNPCEPPYVILSLSGENDFDGLPIMTPDGVSVANTNAIERRRLAIRKLVERQSPPARAARPRVRAMALKGL